jgi:hypothetical protein
MLTPKETKFLDFIQKNQPICDMCCAIKLKYEVNQDANGTNNSLAKKKLIKRQKSRTCINCGSKIKIVNFT